MEQKNALLSKTLWVNLIMAVSAFIPVVGEFISKNPELVTVMFTIINMVLRLVTKKEISIS